MNKKCIFMAMLFLFALTAGVSAGDLKPVEKQTYLYSVKGTDSLWLDRYEDAALACGKQRPCVVFMFGGGFVTGTRDAKEYIPYFEFLARSGYCVVSIDYRRGLRKIVMEKQKLSASGFVSAFVGAVEMAVEDLFDATGYIIANSGQWNVDKNMIIANGSSAGAISVLQGEYNICNRLTHWDRLPAGFNYAGVVAFAGAMFTFDKGLKWDAAPCPIQFFHGNSDSNVPYDKIKVGRKGLYGPKYITGSMLGHGFPYEFFTFDNFTHVIAVEPMNTNRDDIVAFIEKFVRGHAPLMLNTEVNVVGKPEARKRFGIMDYVKSNFGKNP